MTERGSCRRERITNIKARVDNVDLSQSDQIIGRKIECSLEVHERVRAPHRHNHAVMPKQAMRVRRAKLNATVLTDSPCTLILLVDEFARLTFEATRATGKPKAANGEYFFRETLGADRRDGRRSGVTWSGLPYDLACSIPCCCSNIFDPGRPDSSKGWTLVASGCWLRCGTEAGALG